MILLFYVLLFYVLLFLFLFRLRLFRFYSSLLVPRLSVNVIERERDARILMIIISRLNNVCGLFTSYKGSCDLLNLYPEYDTRKSAFVHFQN